MTKESAIEVIKEALSESLGRPVLEIDSSTGLESHGLDSLGVIEFVTVLEDKLGFNLSPKDSVGVSSIEKLADVIVKKKG